MKTLVIYYSLDGNSALIAEKIKTATGAQICKIKTKDARKRTGIVKFFWALGQMLKGKKVQIVTEPVDINAFDLLILGTPVWGGSPASAMLSFLDKIEIKGKKVALYCCHAGGMGKTFEILKDLLKGNTIAGEIDFLKAAQIESNTLKQRIEEWVNGINS